MTRTLRSAIIAILLCVTGTTLPTTTTTESESHEDPDIAWAEDVGPELRARISAAVEAYLADPDMAAPSCWEDEAVVVIVDYVTPESPTPKTEPYVVPERVGELGCVAVDDLPTTGYRP